MTTSDIVYLQNNKSAEISNEANSDPEYLNVFTV